MEVIKVAPRGYCKGVTQAIAIAQKCVLQYPDQQIYILGMLVHNTYVMEALKKINIIAIDDKKKTRLELLDEITEGVVIFTAHGIAPNVIEKAKSKGLICVDASCLDVVKTQDIILEQLEKGSHVLYIGKQYHPEAEAVCSLGERVHLITDKESIDILPVYEQVFVTNQTTMSIFDIEALFDYIKIKFPNAVFCEEICNATRIRQEAVVALEGKEIDVLYVVGDSCSNNSNRLAQIAKERGIPNVYLVDDVNGIQDEQLHQVKRVAVTAGASTPTYLTKQVIFFLENYESIKVKPVIDIAKIL